MSNNKGIISLPKSPHIKDWGFGDSPYMKDGEFDPDEVELLLLRIRGCKSPVNSQIQTYLEMLREYITAMLDEKHPTIQYYSQKWKVFACFPKDFDSMSEEEAKHLVDMITVPRTKIDFLK